jgi:YidC/Oxa1 family membrane protein insertase
VGILNPLYAAVSWILVRWHDLFSLVFDPDSGAAWALSIAGLVVVIRIALLPLFAKQIRAQRGLQALQPQMREIQKKYANDKQKQSEELMKLYRETGTNPFSSCLPIFVQMPFFFALFHVLNAVARDQTVGVMTQAQVDSMSNATLFGAPISATFLGSDDINVKIVAAILIVLMSLTTFTTQRQLMVKNMPVGVDNPLARQQKMLVYVFPLMFAVFGVNFPIGVLIYWLVTNLWTMGQQFYVIRRNPTPGSAAYDALQERKKAKGIAQEAESPAPEPAPKAQRVQPTKQSRSQRASGNPPKSGGNPPKSGGNSQRSGGKKPSGSK